MRILITGASRGIGASLVNHYISQCWDTGSRDKVFGCARSRGAGADYLMDITNEADIAIMLKGIGDVDILINCAGVASMNHIALTTYDKMKEVINTNLLGTALMCREVSRGMLRQKYGRIINVSTIAVPLALAGEAVYVASKAGVEALTHVLSKELAPDVTVNCVAPTVVADTNGDLMGLSKGVATGKIQALIDKTSTKRPCEIGDIVKVVDFFIENEMVTGQTIYLGGV